MPHGLIDGEASAWAPPKIVSANDFLATQGNINQQVASFRLKPESSDFTALRTGWTPVFTGVTA